jgi:SPASM domain peptide maturase of grasp-with-spasm system
MKTIIYKLCQNCKLINGISRSCIYDLQRQQYYPVPHTIKVLFNEANEINLGLINNNFPNRDEWEVIEEYIQFLVLNDLVIEISDDEALLFPDLDTSWDYPAHISNCLIDANREITWLNVRFINQLEILCCHFIQIRFFKKVSVAYLKSILSYINRSAIKVVEFTFPESGSKSFYAEVKELVQVNKKIRSVTIHSSKENALTDPGKLGFGIIISTQESINNSVHCGVVHPAYFTMNIPHYTESLAHNTCLNRKISIDIDGNIKNCPSMKESFGNIKDTTLEEAINKPGFTKYWNITKDEIAKCKDCEFRHVCTDCRAYLENPDDVYSAPLKCGYNPHTCEWEEWSTNPLKQRAIEYYRMNNI